MSREIHVSPSPGNEKPYLRDDSGVRRTRPVRRRDGSLRGEPTPRHRSNGSRGTVSAPEGDSRAGGGDDAGGHH